MPDESNFNRGFRAGPRFQGQGPRAGQQAPRFGQGGFGNGAGQRNWQPGNQNNSGSAQGPQQGGFGQQGRWQGARQGGRFGQGNWQGGQNAGGFGQRSWQGNQNKGGNGNWQGQNWQGGQGQGFGRGNWQGGAGGFGMRNFQGGQNAANFAMRGLQAGPKQGRAGQRGWQGQNGETDYNDRMRQLYAAQLSPQNNMEIFTGTDFLNWGYWTETTKDQNEASENILELIISFLPEKKGRILDVACGKGATTRHLLKYFKADDVMGINISPDQIAACRELVPSVTFEEMDAADMKLEDNAFDNMMSVEAICHFHTREKFLAEALRVLKPGGRLVFTDSLLQADSQIQPDENYLESAAEYQALALKAGFAKAEVFDTTVETWDRFSQYHMNNAIQKVQNGESPRRLIFQTRMWLQRALPVAYVVGWMEKPA